ncbi:RluA family pseudouridine synthase [Tetragenococcus halophilus]|uniref:RluA family pseudouridine synthase n=1 Tax=Tetragenococcus halophilus TaxID=51669 RepID=UPI0021BB5C90|nr:RluA family pseudouridine synthase [Tetragenococcus halophilus]MCT8311182.1 RluA family pseudouridine synthase [Tetragenococcus halophilus]GMQ74714.1 RluA family pseudouridine synthase [Tetragenococcus halophilus]
MEYSITLPTFQKTITLRELLETEWLVPRKVRHFLRTRKNVWCNQQPIKFHEMVHANDIITLRIEEDDYNYQTVKAGAKENIEVLYEDEHLIVVNKASGVKTHPNQPDETATLLNDLSTYLGEKNERPYVVHRLDKETSGAILFAKNPLVLPILGRLLEEKKIYRNYQAIVWGKLTQDCTIDKKIGRDRHDKRKRIISERQGKTAITYVKVHRVQKQTSEVYCSLATGRTHQIRVHLASIGHPVVGDPLYQSKKGKCLALHAYKIKFLHPFTREQIEVIAKPGLW